MDSKLYWKHIDILKNELVPAMGCTEPIAVAYAGALARKTLGTMPAQVKLTVSGNIIKNVKSVIVPHTGGRKGLQTAVMAGICYGDAEKELEVLSEVSDEELQRLDAAICQTEITVTESSNDYNFDIQAEVFSGQESALVRIVDKHTNVVCIAKNDTILVSRALPENNASLEETEDCLSIEGIVEFADTADIADIREILDRQISYNMDIAETGMKEEYGAAIGRILMRAYGGSVQNRAKAWAAAGSDARMSGCEKPVIINSGSGNQGITASVPVIIYARECGASQELLYRALLVSNLVTIHLKHGIGSLSAYCGATSAGAGAGAGICYLYGGKYDEIAHTVVNALAINSGMICDGAKASCAAKIASAVEAGLLGWQMYAYDSQFYGGDGIVITGVENTIQAVNRVARDGMKSTDKEIIQIMLGEQE